MRRVTFAVTYPSERAHPIHRRIMGGTDVSRMALLAWGPTASVTSLAWYDADRAVVAALLEDLEVVASSHLLERDGGTYAFTYQEQFALDAAVMDLIERSRVVFLPPIVFEASGVARFEAVGEQTDLSAFYHALRSELAVEIEQVEPFRRQSAATGLTDRQRAALAAAVEVGYYEVPRTACVGAVASRLDCATSTAGELLRKAERAVVTDVVGAPGMGRGDTDPVPGTGTEK